MPTVVTNRQITTQQLVDLCSPYDGIVRERVEESGDTRFVAVMEHGPFRKWIRTVSWSGDHNPTSHVNGVIEATQTVDFQLGIPIWGPLFTPLVRREARRFPDSGPRNHHARHPWWAPPQRMGRRESIVIALLCVFSVITGYLGTLLTQTNTFFKQEFQVTDAQVGVTLAGVRIGALIALIVVIVADRRGRRRVLLAATIIGCIATATGAVVPNLAWLGVSQTVARAFSTAMALIIGIIAVEETPSGSRAFAVSVLTATAALGSGFAVMLLWVADLGLSAWRILYLVPLIAIPVTHSLGRQLPETRRFRAHVLRPSTTKSRETRIPRGRLALLATSGLLGAAFLAPASGFLNEYLRTGRGFSAGTIIAFQLLTNTPGGIGLVIGGQLADRFGRRKIGSIGLASGVAFTVAMYLFGGWSIWLWSLLGAVLGAAAVPALAVYGPELFPTSARGRANGVINLFSVAGSSIGLALAGVLADNLGGLGLAMLVLSIGPMIVVFLIITVYPETTARELEEINPADAPFESSLTIKPLQPDWREPLDPEAN